MISQSELKSLLNYSPDTGVFTWKRSTPKVQAGSVAGSVTKQGYLRITVNHRHYMAHRLAWLYVYGEWPNDQVDHKNMRRDDNRIANLRVLCNADNKQNSGKQINNTSGVKGVYWHKKTQKWQANIMVRGKRIALGYFNSVQDAASARFNAERTHHPFSLQTQAPVSGFSVGNYILDSLDSFP